MNAIRRLMLFAVLTVPITHGEPDNVAKGVSDKNYAFVAVPDVNIPNNHKILNGARIELVENGGSFDVIIESENKNSLFGAVFLSKKKVIGLPIDKSKRIALFDLMDRMSKNNNVLRWYVFQMRSTDQTLIGIYGPDISE